MNRNQIRAFAIAMVVLVFALDSVAGGGGARPAPQGGQQPASAFKAPDTIDFRSANIMSEGVRLHAELFSLKTLSGKQLPTVIMAHGWGGTAAGFRRDAIELAAAGYLAITFDYRGWGEMRFAGHPHRSGAFEEGWSEVHRRSPGGARGRRSVGDGDRLVQRHPLGNG